MEERWMRFMLIIPWLLILVEGTVFLGCGVYQLVSGKESFLMRRTYGRRYNYEKHKRHFARGCGVLYVITAVFLVLLLLIVDWLKISITMFLTVTVAVEVFLGVTERLMIRRFTDNLEQRKY